MPHKKIRALGGSELLQKHNNSMSKMLTSVYPDYEWVSRKFERVPSGYWNEMKNQRKFMDWVFIQLKLATMEDWYKITTKVNFSS